MYQHWRLSGPLLAALAFHLSDVPFPQQDKRCRQSLCYARAVFGQDICQQVWQRLLAVLVNLGYSSRTQEMFLSAVLSMLMLENGDPRLESFTPELLIRGQQHRTEGIARAVGKVSHGLAAMGILPRPLRMRGYISWREKNTDGIAPKWAAWCRRWRETSVLRLKTRESSYSIILRIGLWLAREHPQVREPKDWTISICADFIAALGRLNVDKLSLASSPRRHL
ncbi:hypothetical protein [Serratia marcescens]|uniref:hypothetical protein n=1 Tax=Serratia marcescens TaxID=615 RepID=UPI001F095CC1|nr:hypothetical protein [Serratia marcescens]